MIPEVCPTASPQNDAICAMIAATNIANISGYEMWSCTTDGIPMTDPCSSMNVWSSIMCSVDGSITDLHFSGYGLIGMIMLNV